MTIQSKLKTLSYLAKPRPFALEKPVVLQFPVIDICNSRCQMCRIWENKKSNDITPDELRRGLDNPLYDMVRSVGLNGGEPTLRKDLGDLTSALFESLPKLKNISLITNAFKTDEVIARISDVGEVVRAHGGNLDVMVSLDGYGELHDKVRGKPGNFNRATKVIEFVKSSDLVHTVRIGCTVIRENVFGLADLFEYCVQEGLYIKYRLGVPHQRLYTRDLVEPYALTEQERYHFAEFLEGLIAHYETNPNQIFFYRSLIGQLVDGAPRQAGCDWQHRGATITSKGELLYCAVESKKLGMIQDGNSEDLYFGNQDHLSEILRTKCAGCNHDYVGIPDKSEQLRQISDRLIDKSGLRPNLQKGYAHSGLRAIRKRQKYESRLSELTALNTHPSSLETRSKRPKVMICGWYGTETLGDKAILAGVAQAIGAAFGDADVTLVSLNPYISRMTLAQMNEFAGWTIATPEAAAGTVTEMDQLVFGGGPIMALDVLAEMEALFQLARKAGVPSVIAGCGVGPLGATHLNDAMGRILNLADHRIYRDEKSRGLAATLGVDTSGDVVAEDPAFTWLKSEKSRASGIVPKADETVVLLGLRDFPWRQYASALPEEECLAIKTRYEKEVVAALEDFVSRVPNAIVRPLPMCTNHFGDDDRWFYRRLFRGNKKLAERIDASLLGRELPPAEYSDAFRHAHVALTMRFHSVVFALGLGVPAVAIDYTLGKGKVKALSERFGIPHQDLATIDRNFIVENLMRQITGPTGAEHKFEPQFVDEFVARVAAQVPATKDAT